MSDYTYDSGGGCLSVPVLLLVCLLLFGMLVAGGGDEATDGNTALSGNEVMSRNQVNAWSDVTNTYYDCYGAYSCVTTTTTSTSTQTTNAPVSVEGDRNNVAGGLRLCVNADGMGYWTANACDAGYTETETQP